MVKADSIGKGLGGFFSSPFGLGLLALGALLIFRDKISQFVQSGLESVGSGIGANININIPAPSFDFGNLFGGLLGDPSKDPSTSDPLIAGDPDDPFFQKVDPVFESTCECGT